VAVPRRKKKKMMKKEVMMKKRKRNMLDWPAILAKLEGTHCPPGR